MSDFGKDDELLKEQFQKGYESIKLPEEFKVAVLSEMKKEAQKTETTSAGKKNSTALEDKAKKKQSKIKVWQIGAFSGALCAAAVVLMILKPGGISYVTPMEDGVYYDTVELKNGEIHFVKNRVAISISPNAGHVTIGGGSLDDTSQEEDIVLEERKTENGGCLMFQETSQVSLPEIAEDNWSNIGKQQIYVTVLKTEEMRYQAAFEKDGAAYQVIGTDVSQKEFIDFLYEKVKE